MKILVVNCGSSSIKYQLLEMPAGKVLARGVLERIGQEDALLEHSLDGRDKITVSEPVADHDQGMALINRVLTHGPGKVIADPAEIDGIGHRVVHGGETFTHSTIIDDRVLDTIQEYFTLAPLHNPPNFAGIKAAQHFFQSVPQVAVFDTAFHQTMPPRAYLYAIDWSLYEKHRIRRYGFHGTSHKFVCQRAAELLGRPLDQLNLISCHLGNGCSMAAIENGHCVDTTMGLTPLEGLVMGTRSGDIDPAIIFHLAERMEIKEINNILNKKSGLLGLSGVSNDIRDLQKAVQQGNKHAELALEIFCYRIRKYIGAYLAVLVRLDAIIFTGGIGENATAIRRDICQHLAPLGIKLDSAKNDVVQATADCISTDDSPTKLMVIPTNEEKMIAFETYNEICKEPCRCS